MGVWCMGVWVYGCVGVWVYGSAVNEGMGVWVYGCNGCNGCMGAPGPSSVTVSVHDQKQGVAEQARSVGSAVNEGPA